MTFGTCCFRTLARIGGVDRSLTRSQEARLNLKPLKALVPHWSVVLVFILISALGFLYYATVQRSTDHLIARNFVYLNEVSAVLTETAEVALQLTRFADYYQCGKTASIGSNEAVACLRRRLVGNSPYVTADEQVTVTAETVTDATNAESAKSGLKTNIRVEPRGGSVTWTLRCDGGKGEDNSRTFTCQRAKLVVPFANIDGLVDAKAYFDTLLIADSDSGAVLFDSATLSQRERRLGTESEVFQSGSYARYNSIAGMLEQWRRLETVAATPAGTKSEDRPEPSTAVFNQSTIVPTPVGGVDYLSFVQPLSTSRLTDQTLLVIGMTRESDFDGARYALPLSTSAISLLLLVLLALSLSLIRIILIEENGVVGRWTLYTLIGSALGLVVLLTLVLSACSTWFTLEKWQDEDLERVADRLVTNFHSEVSEKVAAMRRAEDAFNGNCYPDKAKGDGKNAWKTACEASGALPAARQCEAKNLNCPESDPYCAGSSRKLVCTIDRVPQVATLFTLDTTGRQRGLYTTVNRSPFDAPINVSSREYFQRVQRNQLWSLGPTPGTNAGDATDTVDLFIDRIKSRSTGHLETVLSVRASEQVNWWLDGPGAHATDTKEEDSSADGSMPGSAGDRALETGIARAPFDKIRPTALVAITRLNALENTVLPAGFGFAVVANQTGEVLFHHQAGRSLLENFYDVTGHDLELKTHIATGLPGLMDLTYKGESVRAAVRSLNSLPLSVVTFYRYQPIRTLIFQFSVSAFIVSMLFLAYQFAVVGLLRWADLALFEPPMRNMETPVRPMWILNTSLAALAVAYLVAIWLAEGWPRLLLVLGGPWIVYAVARTLGARFLAWVVGGPSRAETSWRASVVLGARWSAFLMAILLGVLPTLAIFYESISLHEYGWRQLNNWSESRAMAGRLRDYEHDVGRYKTVKPAPSATAVNQALATESGFYLPHAALQVRPAAGPGLLADSGCRDGFGIKAASHRWLVEDVPRARLSGRSVHCAPAPRSVATDRDGLHPIQAVLKWLPDMTRTRSMLERFAASRELYGVEAACTEAPGSGADFIQSGWVPEMPFNSCWRFHDTRYGLVYDTHFFFPHYKFAGGGHYLVVFGLLVSLLLFLWFATLGFLNLIAPIHLIQVIRERGRQELSLVPLRPRTFYSVVPASVGDSEKQRLHNRLVEQLELSWLDDNELGRFLAVREMGDRSLVLLRDFETLMDGDPAEESVRGWLREREQSGVLCLLVVSRLDLRYLRTRQFRGEEPPGSDEDDWEHLLTDATYVPFYKLSGEIEAAMRSGPPAGDGVNDDTLYITSVGTGMEPRDYFRQWELSSPDERIALASLAHNGVANISNVPSLFSLYSRGLIAVAPLGLKFRLPSFANYVRRKMPRDLFKQETAHYHDEKWRIFRAPLYILLGAVTLFLAYSVQDELANVIKVFGGFGATLGLLKSIGDRYQFSVDDGE